MIVAQQRWRDEATRYLQRRAYRPLPMLPSPDPTLKLVVVIPALAEPEALLTLDALAAAHAPGITSEVLLVVNAAENADAGIQTGNKILLQQASDWARRSSKKVQCHVLDYCDIAAADAGVGLARKLGMDIALARLAASERGRGIIACLDADCSVEQNYLREVATYFATSPDAVAATIYFEHPLETTPSHLQARIIDYELHLRCYRHGLRQAGSRYDRYTVGSAMAVRSEIYAQEGGMNRRVAGEDFYFLNKLLKRGRVGEINTTRVYPAARISTRVPFGTGATMADAANKPVTSYHPQVYLHLARLIKALNALACDGAAVPQPYARFLQTMRFGPWLEKTRANVSGPAMLADRMRRWLDGFRTMKFVHWLTELRYPRVAVDVAARAIAARYQLDATGTHNQLLNRFRQLDQYQQ